MPYVDDPNFWSGDPQELVWELEISPGTFADVTDYVVRESMRFEWVTGKYASKVGARLQKEGGGLIVQEWSRLRIYDPYSNNGSDGYVRYFYGFLSRVVEGENGTNVTWQIDAVDGNSWLETGSGDRSGATPTQITTPWPTTDGPVGISDKELLWDGFTLDGTPYQGLLPTFLPEVDGAFTTVITSLPHMSFTACTVKDALDQVVAQASSSQRPQYYVRIIDDDFGTSHSHDNWGWILEWFDETVITPLSITLNNQAAEDSTHKNYGKFSRTRDGAKVITYQAVLGANGAFGYAVNTDAETLYGRRIAGKPIVDSSLQTNAACTQRAQAVINALGAVRETIATGTVVRLDPNLLAVPHTVNLQSSLHGGLGSPVAYAIQRTTLTFPGGCATYDFEVGAAFTEFGDKKLPGFVGGAVSVRDVTPPAVPTGLSTLENVYEGQSHSSRWHLHWNASSDGDLDYYAVDLYWYDGTRWVHRQIIVPGGSADPNLNELGLVPGRTYYAAVRAFDTSGNGSAYCTPISIVATAADSPNPPTGLAQTATGTGWTPTIAYSKLAWTLPGTNTAATWEVYGAQHDIADEYTRRAVVAGTQLGAVVDGLLNGQFYYFKVRGVTQWGDAGAFTPPIHVQVGKVPLPIGNLPRFDLDHPDATLVGWELAATNTDGGSPTLVSTPLYAGLNRARFAPANAKVTAWQTLPIAGAAGQYITLGIARVSNQAIGTNATARAYVDAYSNGGGTTLISSQALFNAAINATPAIYEGKTLLPANTVVWRLRLEAAASATGVQVDFAVWDSRPATTVASTGPDSVTGPAIATGAIDASSKFAAGVVDNTALGAGAVQVSNLDLRTSPGGIL